MTITRNMVVFCVIFNNYDALFAELNVLLEENEGENISSYSKVLMIFYFDRKELLFKRVGAKVPDHDKNSQFVIPCKDIIDVC